MSTWKSFGIFCDDFRLEVRGKHSLIGCYDNDMIVDEFPIKLPQLFVFFKCSAKYNDIPEEGKIRFVIEDAEGSELNKTTDFDFAEMRSQLKKGQDFRFQGALVLPFFEIKEEMKLSLFGVTNDEKFEIVFLNIKQREADE